MTISNTCDNNSVKRLQLATPYAILFMCHKSRKDGSHDSDRRNISDIRRGSTTPSLIRGNSTQTLTAKEDTRLQSWELLAHQSVRVGAIHQGTKEKVASQEAQNVESLQPESLPDTSDNRPRSSVQVNQPVPTTFVRIVLTSCTLCQEIRTSWKVCVL